VKPAERNQQRQILDQIQKHQVPRKLLTMAAAGARSLGLILGDKASLPQNHRRNRDAQPPNNVTLMSLKNTNAKSVL
jgi:hypothetical protein